MGQELGANLWTNDHGLSLLTAAYLCLSGDEPGAPRACMSALTVGAPAPAFMTKTHTGKSVNVGLQPVGSLTRDGHVGVLLWFYPKASTGG